MDDRERMREARTFFWKVMDRLDQTPSLEEATRAIAEIASCLPPFTKIKDPRA